MNIDKKYLWSVLMSTALLVSEALYASPVSLTFAGTVTSTSSSGFYANTSGAVTGLVIFDTVGVDDPYAPGGQYSFLGSPYSFQLNFSNGTFLVSENFVEVLDNGGGYFPTDTVSFTTKSNAISYLLLFHGPNGSFAGDAIPSISTLTSFWTSASLVVIDPSLNTLLVAQIDSAQYTPVPLPSAAILAISGILFLGRVATKRRRLSSSSQAQGQV